MTYKLSVQKKASIENNYADYLSKEIEHFRIKARWNDSRLTLYRLVDDLFKSSNISNSH